MNQRLFLAPPLAAGAERTLDSDDSHYLVRVLRLKPGAQLHCFDGEGHEWAAQLTHANTRASVVTIGALARSAEPPDPQIHLAQGWLKGQAMDQTVQKATELGVTDLWPITALRSNVKIDARRAEGRMRHWQRIARSAAEQSGRLYLPTLHSPRSLEEFLRQRPCDNLLFFEPGCEPLPKDLAPQSLALMIGPEGGWTPEECDLAKLAKANLHGLGDLVLRAETAPLAVLAAVRHGWGWR
jgi:16S rRNA (uracil1498-N3)-methyltransferase